MIVSNYASKTWLERRKAFCDWILKTSEWSIEKIEVKTEWLRNYMKKTEGRTHQCNYFLNCKFYVLYPDYEEYPRAESYNGQNFSSSWNTRDILLDEGVFEFERGKDWAENIKAFWIGCEYLLKFRIHFAVFYATGMRTPHIHCYGLFPEVNDWAEKEMVYYLFCQKVFPIEIRHLLDTSLAGQQTIALEFAKHWRTGHIKKLLFESVPGVENAVR